MAPWHVGVEPVWRVRPGRSPSHEREGLRVPSGAIEGPTWVRTRAGLMAGRPMKTQLSPSIRWGGRRRWGRGHQAADGGDTDRSRERPGGIERASSGCLFASCFGRREAAKASFHRSWHRRRRPHPPRHPAQPNDDGEPKSCTTCLKRRAADKIATRATPHTGHDHDYGCSRDSDPKCFGQSGLPRSGSASPRKPPTRPACVSEHLTTVCMQHRQLAGTAPRALPKPCQFRTLRRTVPKTSGSTGWPRGPARPARGSPRPQQPPRAWSRRSGGPAATLPGAAAPYAPTPSATPALAQRHSCAPHCVPPHTVDPLPHDFPRLRTSAQIADVEPVNRLRPPLETDGLAFSMQVSCVPPNGRPPTMARCMTSKSAVGEIEAAPEAMPT